MKFKPEEVANAAREAFELNCSPSFCSKEQYKEALEELISMLEGSLECVKEELEAEDEG